MADKTASSSDASFQEKLIGYVKTQKGLILAAEIVLGLVIFICYAASWYGSWIGVPISGAIVSVVFFVVFMMELDKRFTQVAWVWSDLLRAGVDSGLYLITSLVMLSYRGDAALITGSVLGLIAGVLYAYDTYTIVLQLKSSSQQQQSTI